jgi:cytochrome b561
MTLNIRRTHWIIFALLLVTQVVGIVVTATRMTDGGKMQWMYFGFFAVPKNMFGLFTLGGMLISQCLVTALIIVSLFDVLGRASK